MLEPAVIVTRRRTSRLSMRIAKDGSVRVSAPWLMPRATIERFVTDHRDWIEKHLVKSRQRQQKSEEFYAGLDISSPKLRKEAACRLDAIVAPMIEKYSAQMAVKPSGITYRAAKSRWGSCNTRTRRISLSLYLLLLPPWCIEHVVVHELAHLLVPDHGPRFYAVMDKHFPRWRDARKETRKLSRGWTIS